MRMIFALAVWVITAIVATEMISSQLFGLATWLGFVALSFPFFVVSVPEVTGLIVLNLITGKLKALAQGLRFKYPWDKVREENFFLLKLVTERHEEDYAAKDGPKMKTKWSYQYIPDRRRLDAYITVDHSTIDDGFTDIISGILSEVVGKKEAVKARTDLEEIQKEVLTTLEARRVRARGKEVTLSEKLENQYGVDFKVFAIADID